MTQTGHEFYCHFLKCNIGFGIQCLWRKDIVPDRGHGKKCKHEEMLDPIVTKEVD